MTVLKKNYLREYEELLIDLNKAGYAICNFKTALMKGNESHQKPKKAAILRHDIHYRDIDGGYKMMEIEKKVIGTGASTYFVQWGFEPVYEDERKLETSHKFVEGYESFIREAIAEGFDVQPHVSPFSFHYKGTERVFVEPFPDYFDELLQAHYIQSIAFSPQTRKACRKIDCIGDDKLEIIENIERAIECLLDYKEKWKIKFGTTPDGFSAHGESKINKRFTYDANKILDDIRIWESGTYKYNANGVSVHEIFQYFSDNNLKDFEIKNFSKSIIESHKKSNKQGIQLLIHPAKWYS